MVLNFQKNDNLIIIQVGYQSLNTNTKIKRRENKLILIFNKTHNWLITDQDNRRLSIDYLITYPYA